MGGRRLFYRMCELFGELLKRSALVFLLTGLVMAGPKIPQLTGLKAVEITGAKVMLNDVLLAQGASTRLSQQLNSATVCMAPQPGRTKVLAGADVLRALESLGLTSERCLIEVPAEIRVSRRAQTLTSQDIEQLMAAEFLPTLPYKKVRIERLEVPDSIQLPEGKVVVSFECPPRTDFARPFFVTTNFSVGSEPVKRVFLRTVLDIEEMVGVAATELSPSGFLKDEDVRWELRRLASTLHKAIRSAEFLEGKKPRTTIPAGRVLTEDLFVSTPLVRRGETITLVYQNGTIRITALGKSQAAGMRGEKIPVVNLDSKRSLIAEVVDKSTVRVMF
jgi:flagella basal body P-ring formation protein FlgA